VGACAPLGRNARHGAFENLEQGLLDTLTRNVPGDRRVLGLSSDLVDLVDVDDAALGALHVKVCRRQQFQKDVLDVLAHVTRLGQGRGVRNGKGHVEHARERLGEECLAAPGGP